MKIEVKASYAPVHQHARVRLRPSVVEESKLFYNSHPEIATIVIINPYCFLLLSEQSPDGIKVGVLDRQGKRITGTEKRENMPSNTIQYLIEPDQTIEIAKIDQRGKHNGALILDFKLAH